MNSARLRELQLQRLQQQIRVIESNKYKLVRTQHPEFADLSDSDIASYIERYDLHMKLGTKPSSITLMTGGCFLLFCDWLFFNAGSAGSLTEGKSTHNVVQLSILNTILSAVGAATAIAVMNMARVEKNAQSQNVTLKFELAAIIGAIMSGCVAGTASCNNVHLSSAFVIGLISAVIYTSTTALFEKLEIDDPLQVSQIHGFCGLWGVLAVGIFDKDTGLIHSGKFN